MELLKAVFYDPLYNALIWLYNIVPGHDLGIAIILLTIIIRFILYPLNSVAIRSQKAMQEIQPKIKAIQKQYKDDKERQAKELMNIYREHKVNPFSSCLPLLIQLPFLIALFWVFKDGIHPDAFKDLYSFVAHPESLNNMSLGFFDITKTNYVLALVAAGLQFWQTRMLMHSKIPNPNTTGKDEDMLATMNKQMMYIFPVMTAVIGFSLPAGLMVYWAVSTGFSIVQQYIVFRARTREAEQKSPAN